MTIILAHLLILDLCGRITFKLQAMLNLYSYNFYFFSVTPETNVCLNPKEFFLNIWNLPFKLKKFFVTGIGMTTADVLTDLYQTVKHFV